MSISALPPNTELGAAIAGPVHTVSPPIYMLAETALEPIVEKSRQKVHD